ncbi:MAG: hypothetical protein ACI3V5_02675 [Faecousia sp.]
MTMGVAALIRSNGNASVSLMSQTVLYNVSIGLGHILACFFGLGLWAVWIATGASWAIRSICFFIRLRSGKWLHKSKLGVD